MLSVVIPARNEEENVEPMFRRLATVLDEIGDEWEIIFSVDPSSDRTEEIVGGLCKRDKRVRMLRFSRRFGQPMAILAGMEASSGDAVVVIDCDMQDPPELIPELVRLWREGFDAKARRFPSGWCQRWATARCPASRRSRFHQTQASFG